LAPDEKLSQARGNPAVCVMLGEERALVRETLEDVIAYTPGEVPILVLASGSQAVERIESLFEGHVPAQREILALALAQGAGFSAALNAAGKALEPGDVVLLAAGARLGEAWLERLRQAAHCDSTVVSATALEIGGGALGVRIEHRSGRAARLVQPDAALAVSSGSPRIRPRIPTAMPHCVYLRRELLERLGGLDETISDPVEALAEISLRALSLGMLHVAADDVLVTGLRGRQPVDAEAALSESVDERTPLSRTLACARAAVQGISVTIDARALGPGMGGTQQYTAELILALASERRLRVRAVVAPDLPAALRDRFEGAPELEVISYEQALAGVERSDIVHRPQQVFSEDDLALLQLLGERVVIGHQDLIAYRNPAYHETVERWWSYRRVTRLALTVADRVVFFSEHAKRDALYEDLVAASRGDVIGIGADELALATVAPEPVARVPADRDLLVCIGADYKHKNRPFAIALLKALRERHGWRGCLVLAGLHVPYGSSLEEEAALLERDPGLRSSVIDVGPVSEAEKAWLYGAARAVVYPTLYEGFGLIPFEAARAGTPCIYGPQASLLELAGPGGATITPWDPLQSSDAALEMLRDGPARDDHLRRLHERMAQTTWEAVVGRLLETYREAILAPYRNAAPRAWQELARETLIATMANNAAANNRAYNDLVASVGIGMPLVAEGGMLSRDEQRGLMRVASRTPLHRLILSPFGALGRVRAEGAPEHGGGGRAGARATTEDAGPHW
jgi:glycosyltransferase involved in cell wall biosynthesis